MVVFKVFQQAGLHGDVEVVRLVGADGHERGAHAPAVQVAGDVAVHIRELVGVEVVRRREAEIPVFGGPQVAAEAKVLRDFAVILHLALIERAICVVD